MLLLREELREMVEHLGPGAERLGEGRRAHRQDHELLHLEAVVRVRSSVDDVHHRRRQEARLRASEVPPERYADLRRGCARRRHRHAEDRVRPEIRLRGRAVELDHRAVDRSLVERVDPERPLALDLRLDVPERVGHPLAEPPRRVAVAKLERLVLARRGSRSAPRRARSPRSRARPRPPPWDCRASPGSAVLERR